MQCHEPNINVGQNTPDDSGVSEELQARLIDLYFEWEQPWFQVVNERLFRESLAYGGRYSSDRAENLLQNDLRWPKITTIQSLAIMGMVYLVSKIE